MNPLSVLLLAATVIYGVIAVDYCSPKLCGTKKHVACGNDGAFLFSCPKDAKMVNITNSLKNHIVSGHNGKRNIVAGGNEDGFDGACRMGMMEWDNELAFLASYTVKQCEFASDMCRNTQTFRNSGQNVYWEGFNGPTDYKEQFTSAINEWYNQYKNTNMEYMKRYPRNHRLTSHSAFAVLIIDKNTHVGCSAVTYTPNNETYTAFLVACNYAAIPTVDHPIYAVCKGQSAGTGCTTGLAPGYVALCSRYETIDHNDFAC